MNKLFLLFTYSLLLFTLPSCSSRKVAVNTMKNETMKNEEITTNEEIKSQEQVRISEEQTAVSEEVKTEKVANVRIKSADPTKPMKIKKKTESGSEEWYVENGLEFDFGEMERGSRRVDSLNQIMRSEETLSNEVNKKEETKTQKREIKKEKTKDIDRNYRFLILWGGILIFVAMLMNWDRFFKKIKR